MKKFPHIYICTFTLNKVYLDILQRIQDALIWSIHRPIIKLQVGKKWKTISLHDHDKDKSSNKGENAIHPKDDQIRTETTIYESAKMNTE